jgi:hypothetical protein
VRVWRNVALGEVQSGIGGRYNAGVSDEFLRRDDWLRRAVGIRSRSRPGGRRHRIRQHRLRRRGRLFDRHQRQFLDRSRCEKTGARVVPHPRLGTHAAGMQNCRHVSSSMRGRSGGSERRNAGLRLGHRGRRSLREKRGDRSLPGDRGKPPRVLQGRQHSLRRRASDLFLVLRGSARRVARIFRKSFSPR